MKTRHLSVPLAALVLAAPLAGSAWAGEKLDPSGTWTWVRELEGQTARSVVKLSYKNGKLTGTYKRLDQEVPISNGKLDKDDISFESEGKWNDQKVHGKFHGKLTKDAIKGEIELVVEDGTFPLAWEAKRGVNVADIVGNWKLKIVTDDGNTFEPTLKLTADGEKLKGAYTSTFGEHEATQIKLDGPELSWIIAAEGDGRKFKGVYKGKPEGNAIKGTVNYEFDGNTGSLEFTGERTVEKKEAPKKSEGKIGPVKKGTAIEPGTKVKQVDGDDLSARATLEGRPIVLLKSRNETLVIHAAAGTAPTFTLRSNDGQTLAKQISLKELQASYPQLYELYRKAYVKVWAGKD